MRVLQKHGREMHLKDMYTSNEIFEAPGSFGF